MTNDVRHTIAAGITPDLVREACDEARARSGGRAEEFYAQLAMALKRRVAAPLPENSQWAVILVAIDGGVRAVLNTGATRFLEPRGMHEDPASGLPALWFSINHETEIAPFATRQDARQAMEKVLATIGQPGLSERLRIVPASRRGGQELLVHLQGALSEEAPKRPETFLSTQVFQAYVEPSQKPG
jgi:hypothetical protein